VAKDPEKSFLMEQITPKDGEAEMPPKKARYRTRIFSSSAAGSRRRVDDTPSNARQRFDLDHPPVYQRPPVITSLAFSPDGSLLAVAGFHEVLLWKADGSELVARLVGLSERIQSVRFSARWQAPRRGGRTPRPNGRSANLGCREAQAHPQRPDRLRHRLRRELVAGWQGGFVRLPG